MARKPTPARGRRLAGGSDQKLRERIFGSFDSEGMDAETHIDAMDQIFKWVKSGALPPKVARGRIKEVPQTDTGKQS